MGRHVLREAVAAPFEDQLFASLLALLHKQMTLPRDSWGPNRRQPGTATWVWWTPAEDSLKLLHTT